VLCAALCGTVLLDVLFSFMNTKSHNLRVELLQWVIALSAESIVVLAILVWFLCRLIGACEWLSP